MPPDASHPPQPDDRREPRTARFFEWTSIAGLPLELPLRLYHIVRRFGFVKATAILVAVVMPIVKYEWAPRVMEAYAEAWADQYGIDLQVRDWSFDLFSLTGIARDVVVRSSQQYSDDKLFQARAVTIEFSLWRRLGSGRWIRKLSIDGPTLHLERLLSGRWNWQDALGLKQAAANVVQNGFDVPHLIVHDMRVHWVENIPGDSGGGIVQTARASVYLDDVSVTADDLVAGTVEPTQASFSIEARTADGQVSSSGNGFIFGGMPQSRAALRAVSASSDGAGTASRPRPRLTFSVSLVNVGAPAMAEIFPLTSVSPNSGWMTGKIDFAMYDNARLDCQVDVNLRNVGYTPNLQSPFVRAHTAALVSAVRDFKVSSRVAGPCGGDLKNERYRPGYAVAAAMTHEAMKSAPPIVRQAALFDEQRMVQTVPPEDALANSIEAGVAGTIGSAASRIVGREAGAALGHSVGHSLVGTSGHGKNDNAVTRGAKSVGHGLKRLFGRK